MVSFATNLVEPNLPCSQHTLAATGRGQSATGSNRPEQIEAALNRLVNGLIEHDFTFVTPEVSPQHMQERLAHFDESRLSFSNKVFGFMMGGFDMPDFAKVIRKKGVGFGARKVTPVTPGKPP